MHSEIISELHEYYKEEIADRNKYHRFSEQLHEAGPEYEKYTGIIDQIAKEESIHAEHMRYILAQLSE